MTLARRIGWNLFAGASGKLIFTALGLVTFAIVTRSLGPDEFGLYRTIFTYLSLVGVLAHFGTPALALREISQPGVNQVHILGNAIALRLALMVVVLTMGVLAVPLFDLDPRIRLGVLVGAVGWTAMEVGNVVIVVFQNRLKQHLASTAEVLGGAVTLGLVAAVAFAGLGLYWMVAAFAAGRVFIAALAWVLADRSVPLRLKIDRDSWLYLLRHGWPLGASVIVSIIIARGDVMVMAVFHPASDVGMYGVASKILEMIVTIPNLLAPLLMPHLVTAARDANRLQTYMDGGVRALIVIGLFIFVALLNFASDIVNLIAGGTYEQAGVVLKIMAPAVIILFVSILFRFVLITMSMQRLMLVADLVGLAVVIPAFGLLIPKWSYTGAAVAMILGHLATLMVVIAVMVRRLDMRVALGFLWKLVPIMACVQFSFIFTASVGLGWVISFCLGLIVYVLLALVTGVVPRSLVQPGSIR